jgi:DNA-binding CsgD family transcriptional regulator/tetratricopeptide (TPR) repeat protein
VVVGSSPGLVGRDDELAILAHGFDRLRDAAGAVIIVEGEAGIGKTRLLDEAERRAREAGVTVRRGAAEELEQGRTFGAFLDALDPEGSANKETELRRRLRAAAGSTDARFLAQEAILDEIESLTTSAPLLLALDDLHWSDRATLAAARALGRRVDRLPLLLVLASRGEPRLADLDHLLADCEAGGAARCELGPLEADSVGELAADVVGTAPSPELLTYLERTGGNPFFVIETLTSLRDEHAIDAAPGGPAIGALSPELRASLLRRVGTLGTDAEEILGVAAVLGDRFAVDDLAGLLDRRIAEVQGILSAAIRADLLEERGPALSFRHDLIREALYEQLPEALRVGLHREAARVLADRLAPAVRARHLVLGAATGDRAAVEGLRAAAAELGSRDPGAAAAILDRAVELETDSPTRAEIASELAAALLAAGRVRDAEEFATTTLAGDSEIAPSSRAALHLTAGEAANYQGKFIAATANFTAAIDLGVLGERDRAYALSRQAENRVWTFDLEPAFSEAKAALAVGHELGEVAVITQALVAQSAIHSFRAEFAEAIETGEAAVSATIDTPDAFRRTPHAYLGLALSGADRHDEARQVVEEGMRRSTALGQVLGLPNYYLMLVRGSWVTGRWDDALAEREAMVSLAEDYDSIFGAAAVDNTSGLIAYHRGDLETARRLRARARERRTPGSDASGSELDYLLDAFLAEADGDVSTAADTLLGLMEMMQALGMRAVRLWLGAHAVRLAMAAGRADRALAVAEDIEGIASTTPTPTAQAAAAAARGLVANDAAALLAAAESYLAGGRPLDAAYASEWAGLVLQRQGFRDDAAAAFNRALDGARALDAARNERRLVASLRDLGVRAGTRGQRRRETTGWAALTKAERSVARLVADGLRNAEIADRLFISRRTAETHVSRLYVKLEVGSRVALAGVVAAQPADPD